MNDDRSVVQSLLDQIATREPLVVMLFRLDVYTAPAHHALAV